MATHGEALVKREEVDLVLGFQGSNPGTPVLMSSHHKTKIKVGNITLRPNLLRRDLIDHRPFKNGRKYKRCPILPVALSVVAIRVSAVVAPKDRVATSHRLVRREVEAVPYNRRRGRHRAADRQPDPAAVDVHRAGNYTVLPPACVGVGCMLSYLIRSVVTSLSELL